jgi:cytochrome c oxidase subunit IV
MSGNATEARQLVGKLWRRNGLIWAALMALLVLTYVLAYVPMGRFATATALAIAFAKAGLVAILYMELAKAKPLIRLAALSGLVFVLVLFGLTLADVLARLNG